MGRVTLQITNSRSSNFSKDTVLIEKFVEDCKLRRLSTETIRSYKSNLEIVSKFLNQKRQSITNLNKETLKNILEYLTLERKVSFKRLANYFSSLSTFSEYLIYEEIAENNPVLSFRRRYLRQYKDTGNNNGSRRKLISVAEMKMLIDSVLNPRDKAIITLFAKTGIRRNELITIDVEDIDWTEQSIRIKPHPKRSNSIVFFDDETARILKKWMKTRKNYHSNQETKALFVSEQGGRLKRNGIYLVVTKHAERVGLHDSESKRMEDHFTPHCCRHWFTTHLRRKGLSREFLKELRGDSRNEAVDIYDHIDKKELKREYLAAIPVLGIG